MPIENIGTQSQNTNSLLYTSLIAQGMQEAYLGDLSLVYDKIARCQLPEFFTRKFPDIFSPDGSMLNPSAALPRTAFFAQMMPLAIMEDLSIDGGGATAYPLIREIQDVIMGPREAKYEVSVWNFRQDVFGTLQAAGATLRRTAEKKADFLLADLLNNGATASCWHTAKTGKNFFDTSIPCDLDSGLNGGTFDNTVPNCPLTAANIAKQIGRISTIRLGDNVPIAVKADTLIVPSQMMYDADFSTLVGSIVYSGAVAGQGNSAPGQAANTAAQGDNVVFIRKYIKNVIYMDVLASQNNSTQLKTWYLADSRAYGLLYARALSPQYAWQIAPNDAPVFENNMFRFKVNTWEGAGYGLPQFIQQMVG